MKLYNIDFDGMYPVGNCLIVLAKDKDEAEAIAKKTILHTEIITIDEVDMTESKVVVYLSGDY